MQPIWGVCSNDTGITTALKAQEFILFWFRKKKRSSSGSVVDAGKTVVGLEDVASVASYVSKLKDQSN